MDRAANWPSKQKIVGYKRIAVSIAMNNRRGQWKSVLGIVQLLFVGWTVWRRCWSRGARLWHARWYRNAESGIVIEREREEKLHRGTNHLSTGQLSRCSDHVERALSRFAATSNFLRQTHTHTHTIENGDVDLLAPMTKDDGYSGSFLFFILSLFERFVLARLFDLQPRGAR